MTASTSTDRPTLVLQPGETILLEGAPVAQLASAKIWGTILVYAVTVVLLPLAVFVPLFVHQSMGWHRWWLTNQRLVVRTGFIGWQLRSVPLDRIVDVTHRASWWDRLWGVEHIAVRDMTGEIGSSGTSTGLQLLGVEDAAAVARRILAETPSSPVRGTDDLGDVVRLLEVLVARTTA